MLFLKDLRWTFGDTLSSFAIYQVKKFTNKATCAAPLACFDGTGAFSS